MDNNQLRRFGELTDSIRQHEDDIEELKKERSSLEKGLLNEYRKDGVQRVTLEGKTYWLDRKRWASAAGPELPQALKLAGFKLVRPDPLPVKVPVNCAVGSVPSRLLALLAMMA